jgi:hypothetical protein
MSKNTTTYSKALKGAFFSGAADLSSLSATSFKLPADAVSSLMNGIILDNVFITNSEIDNTIIGQNGNNEGVFTKLTTTDTVTFESVDLTKSVVWDAGNGILNVVGNVGISGCATIGNIQICKNLITAINTNGDVTVQPNALGTINLSGPINNQVSSFGNYFTNLANGNVTFISSDYINLTSNKSYLAASTFLGQTFSTVNGDVTFNTDTGLSQKFITSITENTNANVVVTTLQNSGVKVGDSVTLSSTGTLFSNNSPIDGIYKVSQILDSNSFLISTNNIVVTAATTGTLIKSPNNSIVLNASQYIKVPTDIPITFGTTNSSSNLNSIVGNTSGFAINAQGNVLISNPDTTSTTGNYIVQIPQYTKFQYGSSGNNYINFDGSGLNISSYNNINVNGVASYINTPDVYFVDPNPFIGNFTTNSSDLSDRGIQFKYADTAGNNLLGWFGYKQTTGEFTFLTNATNNNELMTGTLGKFDIGTISVTNISINSGGVLDLGCGTIKNVQLITGCGGTVNINASQNVNITTANRLALISGGDVFMPNNIPLTLGTSGAKIYESTNGTLMLTGFSNLRLITQTNGSVIIPIGTKISFDNTSIGSTSIVSDTSGNFYISTNKNLTFNMSGGNLKFPQNNSGLTNVTQNSIQFGTTTPSEVITGSTAGINILTNSSFGTLNLLATSNVNISNSTGSIVLNTLNGDIDLYATNGNVRILASERLIFNDITGNTTNSIRTNSAGNFLFNGPGTGGNQANSSSGNTFEIKNAFNLNLSVVSSGNINVPTNVFLNIGNNNNTSFGNTYLINDTANNLSLINNASNGNLNALVTRNINITSSNLNINNTATNVSSQTLTVTGSLTQINSTHLTTIDPIPAIGNYTSSASDLTDRGIEYNWYNTSTGSTQLGWFGYKQTTGQFTYYSSAVNNNNVISGTQGQFALGSAIISNSLNFVNAGNIDMNCGTISNLNTILGCHGTVNINASSTINASATNMLFSTSKLQLPYTSFLSFGNTQNNISVDTNGTMTLTALGGAGQLILNGNVQINGTTENVYSTVTNIQDPVISIGGVTGPVVSDGYDRGIEYKWYNTSSLLGSTGSVIGFFGLQNSTNRFTFIPNAFQVNNNYFGSTGNVQFANGYFNNLDVACGTVSNVNTLTGCNGAVLNILSTSGVSVSTANLALPFTSKLSFGNTNNSISATTSGSLLINSTTNINLNATSGGIQLATNTSGSGFVNVASNTPLNFGSGSSGSTLVQDTSGNLNIINSSGNINLTPSGLTNGTYGSVILPTNTSIIFSGTNSNNRISSDGSQLNLYGYSSVGINSSTVTIAGNVNIIGAISATTVTTDVNEYILPLGTSQIGIISSITNTTSTGNILVTTLANVYLGAGDSVTLKNTDTNPVVDGIYTIVSAVSANSFIVSASTLTKAGTTGTIKSILTTAQNKDVGIAVDRWSSTVGNTQITAGSAGYTTGFFGWKSNLDRWVFYDAATISNDVVTGTSFGNIQINELFTNKIGGFALDGTLQGGSFIISGTNFQIQGGSIDSTPIGANTAQTGRFTTLSSTVSTDLTAVKLQSTLAYSIERFTLSSLVPTRNPNTSVVTSYVSISGATFGGVGTMSSTSIADGQMKKIVMSSIGPGCSYTLFFGVGKITTPNPLGGTPSKIVFKRSGQSCEVMWDNNLGSWILMGGSGGYVQ